MDSTSSSTAATPLHVTDVVRIPSGSEAIVESINLEDSTAVCAWSGTRSTFNLADLVWLRPGDSNLASSDATGTAAATEDAADLLEMEQVQAKGETPIPWDQAKATLGEETPQPSIVERVKEFWQHADEDVKAAFHGEILGKIDELGPGSSVNRDEFHATVTAWRNGTRIHGHGTTTAEALADFHRQAGPAA